MEPVSRGLHIPQYWQRQFFHVTQLESCHYLGLTSFCMHSMCRIHYTCSGPNWLQEDLTEPDWLSLVCLCDIPSLNSSKNNKYSKLSEQSCYTSERGIVAYAAYLNLSQPSRYGSSYARRLLLASSKASFRLRGRYFRLTYQPSLSL